MHTYTRPGRPCYFLTGDAGEALVLGSQAREANPELRVHHVNSAADLPPLPGDAVIYASSMKPDVSAALKALKAGGKIFDLMSAAYLLLAPPHLAR